MNLKKSLAALVTLAALLMPFAYTALAGDAPEEKLSVVSVNFPGFDFARRIVGDRAEASMLLAPGAESHTYEPAPRDILKIQNCDLFIYTGGHSEAWVEDILSSMDRQIPVLRMMDAVDVVADVTIEGMTEGEHGHGHEDHGDDAHGDEAHEDDAHGDEGHEDEDHGHDAHEDDARGDEDHEGGHVHGHDDEHVWTSPVNAMAIEQAIADKLAQIDPDGAQVYQANAQEYAAGLDALDRQFRDFSLASKTRPLSSATASRCATSPTSTASPITPRFPVAAPNPSPARRPSPT